MKTPLFCRLFFLCAITASQGFAQGSLTPPGGAPAPVYKTLDQVEARRPLVDEQMGVSIDSTNGTITISQPGSYYLTDNLYIDAASAHGIHIMSSNVSLDLNGYSLICTGVAGGYAILLNNVSSVRVSNGHIRGGTTWGGARFILDGWQGGIISSSTNSGQVVTDVIVIGTKSHGIQLSTNGSRVERCTTDSTGGYGIYASSISFCTARTAGNHAIYAVSEPDSSSVDNCFGEAVMDGAQGIRALDGNVNNSRGTATSDHGIDAKNAFNSTGVSVSGTGVRAEKCAMNCSGESESGIGLFAHVASNCFGKSDSGSGLVGVMATNCEGESTSGAHGIMLGAIGTASFCRGTGPAGDAIFCNIAVACTSGGGSILALSKQLGTP